MTVSPAVIVGDAVETRRVNVDVVLDPGTGVVRVRATGDIDELGVPALRDALTVAATHRPAAVEVDLGAATFFSCAGVAALLAAHTATEGRIVLVDASTPVRRLLDVLGLDTTFRAPSRHSSLQ
jgi:anti-anti-sigma factor